MSYKVVSTLHINSRDRTVYSKSSTNFTVTFQNSISPPQDGRNYRISLTKITMPLTFFRVNGTNDYIIVRETFGGTSTTFEFRLDKGNYNSDEIIEDLVDKLNDNSPNGFVYAVSLDETNGLLTFSFTVDGGDSSTTASFLSSNSRFLADDLLGLTEINDFTIVHNTPTVAPSIVNFYGLADQSFVVKIGNLGGTTNYSTLEGKASNAIAVVPITAGYTFDVYTYQTPLGVNSTDFNGAIGNDLRFEITDTRDVPLDLNGRNIQLQLVIYYED